MNDRSIARNHFVAPYVHVRRRIHGHRKATIDVVAAFGHGERTRGLERDVRRTETPCFREADRLRQIGGCTLLSAIVHPVRDCLDLLIREAAFTLKHAMSVDRLPWRHRLQEDSFPDRSRPRPRVRIGHQREGRDVAGPMACLTMLLKNADNLIVECCLAVGIR